MRKEKSQILHRPVLVSVEFSGNSPPAIGCDMTRQRPWIVPQMRFITPLPGTELINFRYALQIEDM
jgi:hypothetical protein